MSLQVGSSSCDLPNVVLGIVSEYIVTEKTPVRELPSAALLLFKFLELQSVSAEEKATLYGRCVKILSFDEGAFYADFPSFRYQEFFEGKPSLSYRGAGGHVTALTCAIGKKQLRELRALSLVSATTFLNEALLHVSRFNKGIGVNILVEAKADVNTMRNRDWGEEDDRRLTSLYYCARWGNVTAARCLIQAKANVNGFVEDLVGPVDYKKEVRFAGPLDVAAAHGHVEMVKLLISAKSNVNEKSFLHHDFSRFKMHPRTALYRATFSPKSKQFEVMQLLVDAGASLRESNVWGLCKRRRLSLKNCFKLKVYRKKKKPVNGEPLTG